MPARPQSRARKKKFLLIISSRASFTLIELLIVIAIVTILSVVVVLTLNPAQLLRQARDSTRLSDLDNLNKALALHQVDVTGGTYGNASTTYVSIPDSSATCVNLGLPSLPTGYDYACATAANYKKVDGSGWIPVNLTQISSGSPLGVLPTDPVNTTSTGNYYTYMTGASWALSSLLESDKFLKQSALNDGGYDHGRYEQGSDLSLVAKNQGLVGWWTMDEGSGATAGDGSGNGNTGTLTSGPSWTTGCKVGGCLTFNGANSYINAGSGSNLNITGNLTLMGWVNITASVFPDGGTNWVLFANESYQAYGFIFRIDGSSAKPYFRTSQAGGSTGAYSNTAITKNAWYHLAVTRNGSTATFYFNGVADGTATISNPVSSATTLAVAGEAGGQPINGLFDEPRIYSRALSAAEIKAIYDATK